MIRTLLRKELRSCWPFAAAALIVQGWIVVSLAVQFHSPLFRAFDLFSSFNDVLLNPELQDIEMTIGLGFGIILGLWQTAPESLQGTAAFWAHTAKSRRLVVTSKILAAMILYAAAVVVPMVAGAAWTLVCDSRFLHSGGWADARYLWVILAWGFAAYLGVLAASLRGRIWPWRRGLQQAAGLVAFGAAACIGLALPWFAPAVGVVAVAGSFALIWAYSGYAAREF